jgi:hypothetical protein
MSKIVLDSTHLRPATMANAREAITLDNINMDVFVILSDLAWKSLEDNPEYTEDVANFNEAIVTVRDRIKDDALRTLENAPWAVATPFGTAMFLLGLQIGRDPMSLLTLGGER